MKSATNPANTAAMPNTGTGSPDYVARIQGLRRSGAAGSHSSRADRRARTRAASRDRAVRRELSAG